MYIDSADDILFADKKSSIKGNTVIILETPRLMIRGFTQADIPLAFAYSQEQCTREQLPDEVFDSPEDAGEVIHALMENYDSRSLPLVYAVALRDTGKLIGHVSLSGIGEGKVEIGYAVATEYQGRGYASELIGPFAEWAKTALRIDKLYGIVKASNAASWKCLEKAGFILVREETRELFGGVYSTRVYIV